MQFADLPLVGMLKQRMSWHQERQSVLAQNVANADTPNYRARDLKEPTFGAMGIWRNASVNSAGRSGAAAKVSRVPSGSAR